MAPERPQVVYEQHGATFTHERLERCEDFMLVVRARVPTPTPWPPADWPPDPVELGEGQIAITQDCEEQFRDRTVYATCTHRRDEADDPSKNETHAIGIATYYTGSVYDNDAEMTTCMREGGTWWRMDENDERAQRAHREYQLAKTEAELERLQGRLRR